MPRFFGPPGQMVCADLTNATFKETAAISKDAASRQPYKQWLAASLRRLSDLGESTFLNEPMYDAATMLRMQSAIGERQGVLRLGNCSWH